MWFQILWAIELNNHNLNIEQPYRQVTSRTMAHRLFNELFNPANQILEQINCPNDSKEADALEEKGDQQHCSHWHWM